MQKTILQFVNITKQFYGNVIFSNLNLTIMSNDMHAIVGKNGSGKTLLMNMLYGLEHPDSGTILYKDHPVCFQNPFQAKKSAVHMAQCKPTQYPDLDIATNIFFGYEPKHFGIIDKKEMHILTQQLFHHFNLKIDPFAKAIALSESEKKILEFLKIYIASPDIAIFDEPTLGLDLQMWPIFLQILRELKQNGTTIIYVTNKLCEVYKYCDNVSIIKEKSIKATYKIQDIDFERISLELFGNTFSTAYPKIHFTKGSNLLQVKNLNVPPILRDISFSIRKKEVVGLVSRLASEGTTLAHAILGAEFSNKEIYVRGQKVSIKSPSDAVACGINYISSGISDLSLFHNENIGYNIAIGNLETSKMNGLVSSKMVGALSKKYIKRLGIKVYNRNQRISYLSTGNQQKVEIAKVLNTYADIIIMDQASNGLDFAGRVDLYNIMNELLKNDAAILFISSDLSEILGICDRVLIIQDKTIKTQRYCDATTIDMLLNDLNY